MKREKTISKSQPRGLYQKVLAKQIESKAAHE
jgi:hypothetical protein